MQYATIRITREVLRAHDACNSGLEIFDHLTDETGVLELEWSPLAALWLAVEYPDEARWLHQRGLIPPANLQQSNLQGLNLRGAYLVGARLDGADLREADLSSVDLSHAHMEAADFRKADLSYAKFHHAHMKSCLLQRAEVREADFTAADLSGATLTGAKTTIFACLRRAELDEVTF